MRFYETNEDNTETEIDFLALTELAYGDLDLEVNRESVSIDGNTGTVNVRVGTRIFQLEFKEVKEVKEGD